MPVTVYRYDDVGAPQLQGQSVGSLIAILDACLVNGYGSKAPSGWTKSFSGTNLAVYRQGAGSGFYLRVDDSAGTNQTLVTAFESMSDVNTGVNQFPHPAQTSNLGQFIRLSNAATSALRPWVLVSDSKRFYLWVGYEFASAGLLSASTGAQGLFFFGDIVSFKQNDAYCCQIIAPEVYGAATEVFGGSSTLAGVSRGHYIARNAAGAVGAIPNAKLYDRYAANSSLVMGSATAATYPDRVSGGINLSRILLNNGAGAGAVAIRGRLPGCWASLNALPGANGDTFSGAGELAGREFILLDCCNSTTHGRVAVETSNTWD